MGSAMKMNRKENLLAIMPKLNKRWMKSNTLDGETHAYVFVAWGNDRFKMALNKDTLGLMSKERANEILDLIERERTSRLDQDRVRVWLAYMRKTINRSST